MSGTIVYFAIVVVGLTTVWTMIQTADIRTPDATCTHVCKCSKRDHDYYVDCSFTNLTSIPRIPKRTVLLNMSHTVMRVINGSPFLNATSLKILDLYNASLLNISEVGFRGLNNLISLNISHNDFLPLTNITVQRNIFRDMRSLEVLRMYDTTSARQVGTYPDEALSALQSLKELWVDGMTNKTLGPGFRNLTNLQSIRFAGEPEHGYCDTDITKGMFDNVKALKHLYVRNCGVRVIDKDAFRPLPQLLTLDLSENEKLGLEKASNAFESLQSTNISILKLNHVYPTGRMICGVLITKSFVSKMQKLNLTELHLEHNAIVSVEKNAMKLLPSTLEVLEVRNNEFKLHSYVFQVSQMQNLKWADLSYQFFPNLLSDKQTKLNRITSYNSGHNYNLPNSNQFDNEDDCKECVASETMADTHDVNTTQPNSRLGNKLAGETNKNIEHIHTRVLPEFMFDSHLVEYMEFEIESKRNIRMSTDTLVGKEEVRVCPSLFPTSIPLVPTLPPKLKYIDISNSKLAHPVFNFTVNHTNSVKQINASRSMLYCWDGPVYGLKSLEYLDLSLNLCTRVRIGFFDELINLKVLLIQMNIIGIDIANDEHGRLLTNLSKLEVLDISFNRISSIPRMFLKSQIKLRILNASCNLLTEFDLNISHMKNLSLIDLCKNHISTIQEDMTKVLETLSSDNFKSNGKTLIINLSENNIHCTCGNIDFLKWVLKHKTKAIVVNITECVFENQTHIRISNNKQLKDIVAYLEKQCASHIPLIVGLVVLFMLFINVAVGILVYRLRWKIRYWYYVAGRRMGTGRVRQMNGGYRSLDSTLYYEQRNAFKYDAYVASAESDRDFVIGSMITNLEKNSNVRLCVPEKDFVPGQSVYRMIGNAINVCRVTIFITSQRSLQDREWEIAMRMAQEESLTRGRKIYFAIFIEDIPRDILYSRKWIDIKEVYKNGAYLDYPARTQDEATMELFWEDCVHMIKSESRINNLQ